MPSTEWTASLQRSVVEWFTEHGRDYPWRNTSDPFHVLVAEVLLRRTQADRVVGPYLELIESYSNMQEMAEADVNLLRQWFRPLGLMGRANWLVEAARVALSQYDGEIPRTVTELAGLPGLGRYSARAVQCMAYGTAVPMIDESSGRLVRRLVGLTSRKPAYSDKGLIVLAETLIPHDFGRSFNLGLLDIAAAYCHTASPNCLGCPLSELCSHGQDVVARQGGEGAYAGY